MNIKNVMYHYKDVSISIKCQSFCSILKSHCLRLYVLLNRYSAHKSDTINLSSQNSRFQEHEKTIRFAQHFSENLVIEKPTRTTFHICWALKPGTHLRYSIKKYAYFGNSHTKDDKKL